MAFTELGDTLSASAAAALTLTLRGPFAAALADAGDDNLVLRAARALAAAAGVAPAAAITLDKRLPVAAGIGGGSADAAAALRLLSRLWGVSVAQDRLLEIAASLGADVPACLLSRPLMVAGVGERLAPLAVPLPDTSIVLANPGVPLATPAVFAARTGPFSAAAPLASPPRTVAALAAALAARGNDLEAPARRLAPAVGEVLAALAATPGCLLSRLSGSGATGFALYPDAAAAAAAAAGLAAAHPTWWVAATRIAAPAQ